jgi:formamidopyrimidine-DNA glycosylase
MLSFFLRGGPMPELPEVETVARQLQPLLAGRSVRRVEILDARLRDRALPRVAGRRVVDVSRSGKRVLVEFGPLRRGRDSLWLAVHLRMTGRLRWVARPTAEDRRHLRARFSLDRGALLFNDTRRFGTFAWYRTEQDAQAEGMDPLAPELSAAVLARLIAGSRQNVKAWLLRQDRLTGLGNIYASEILHAARISPLRTTDTLTRSEVERLHRCTRHILRRAIRNCGTTFSDFQDARGLTGSYQRYLAVYGREDRPCRRCREPIRRIVQQQRSTFHCSGCQI